MHRDKRPLTLRLASVVSAGQRLRAGEAISVTTFVLAYAAKRETRR